MSLLQEGRTLWEQQGEQQRQQHVVGRPWPKGTSGNPRGRPVSAATKRREREEWLRNGLAEALGGLATLTVDQQALLDMVVQQTVLVEGLRGSERTRATNVLLRLRVQLGLDQALPRRVRAPALPPRSPPSPS